MKCPRFGPPQQLVLLYNGDKEEECNSLWGTSDNWYHHNKNVHWFIGNCIYWRPQNWRLVANSEVVNPEVVNPECTNYIYWRPYLVWFVFVCLHSGGWFGAQNSGADRNWGFFRAKYMVSEMFYTFPFNIFHWLSLVSYIFYSIKQVKVLMICAMQRVGFRSFSSASTSVLSVPDPRKTKAKWQIICPLQLDKGCTSAQSARSLLVKQAI